MFRRSTYLRVIIMVNAWPLFTSQACDYVKNIEVQYSRFTRKLIKTAYLSGQCISETAIRQDSIKAIKVICKSPLLELKRDFIKNMPDLEKVDLSDCNITKLHAGTFGSNLPKLKDVSLKNNNISTVPKGVFDGISATIKQLFLTGNRITSIDEHAFANLPALYDITLNYNNLTRLSRNWFTNSTNIRRFFASHNQIQEIPEAMFKGWRKADWFDLSWNNIVKVHKDAFVNVASTVDVLTLHANELKEIDIEAFANTYILEFSISVNMLNYLPRNFLERIRARRIDIFANPFKCSCLEIIQKMLVQFHVNIGCGSLCVKNCNAAAIPICAVPSESENDCVESIDEEVNNKLRNYLNKIGYRSVRHWAENCSDLS